MKGKHNNDMDIITNNILQFADSNRYTKIMAQNNDDFLDMAKTHIEKTNNINIVYFDIDSEGFDIDYSFEYENRKVFVRCDQHNVFKNENITQDFHGIYILDTICNVWKEFVYLHHDFFGYNDRMLSFDKIERSYHENHNTKTTHRKK